MVNPVAEEIDSFRPVRALLLGLEEVDDEILPPRVALVEVVATVLLAQDAEELLHRHEFEVRVIVEALRRVTNALVGDRGVEGTGETGDHERAHVDALARGLRRARSR
jgi:hypothetical protein